MFFLSLSLIDISLRHEKLDVPYMWMVSCRTEFMINVTQSFILQTHFTKIGCLLANQSYCLKLWHFQTFFRSSRTKGLSTWGELYICLTNHHAVWSMVQFDRDDLVCEIYCLEWIPVFF